MTTLGTKDQNQKLIANTNSPYNNLGGTPNKPGGAAPNARHDQIDLDYRIYNWLLVLAALGCVGSAVRWVLNYTLTLNIILLVVLLTIEAFLCFLSWRAKRHFSYEQQTTATKLWIYYIIIVVLYYGWRFLEAFLQTGFNSFTYILKYAAADLVLGIVLPAYFWRTGKKLEDELPRN